ncbi:hypothetical protein LOTGIDRAFT_131742 [Lottia gigantea]|uniref:Neutral ceramidase n=1 Tax=Lottia gigantea TaxID=225164 RepID=V3ZKC6_LOTGI|nr:hypothetical protein LOTGIDRAFT_131742 [Lottia gigantea]ESO84722.1 hypothetical protein LOTGIDRAFT_131742 [Lottia gigantea]
MITLSNCVPTNFLIGAGISDVTGPAAEVNMMGYANPVQTSHGIHIRQYSRAYIVADKENKTRVVFVNVDSCMLSQGVKLEVIKRLKSKYGGLYTERNVGISGIHTHSGPGGFHQYLLFDITSLGFVKESFEALVDGITLSIQNAHDRIQPANIYINSGLLLDSNINRSPSSYLNNPASERKRYEYNVDKNMTILKFADANDKGFGMMSWFAVHCTSMNNTNGYISGDNKGYAAQLFEQAMNKDSLPGKVLIFNLLMSSINFVAAFGQSNEGDVSPNTKGPHCQDTGLPCDILHSTCHGKNELCIAAGPGKDMVDSTRIIGENQYKKALELYNSASNMITGTVDFRHTYVDMTNVQVKINSTTKVSVKTCKPAMGYAFAAGTTDGPGMFNFEQGANTTSLLWDFVRDFLHAPSKEQVSCHHPKPILLDTGEIKKPYQWQPDIVDVQILKIGQLAVIALPAEFTTMSGRRMRESVEKAMSEDTVSVIAGLTNDYADYVATYEEYQVQRYEAASTIYCREMIKTEYEVPGGPNPPNLIGKQLSFLPPVIYDTAGTRNYGDIITDVKPVYSQNTSVQVTMVGANPRNNIKLGKTFLEIEKKEGDDSWSVVATDSNWDTFFHWESKGIFLLGESQVTITWNIPAKQPVGSYRIKYHGDHKNILGTITAFTGTSSTFTIKAQTHVY